MTFIFPNEFCTPCEASRLETATQRCNSWKSVWKSRTAIFVFPKPVKEFLPWIASGPSPVLHKTHLQDISKQRITKRKLEQAKMTESV